MVSEKRLRIEMGVIYEMIHDNKMSIKWIEASKQLADSLTKRGASSSKLNQVLDWYLKMYDDFELWKTFLPF